MRAALTSCAALFTLAALSLFASEETQQKNNDTNSQDIKKISEAFGHLIGKNLDTIGFHFDMQSVVQGLRDASDGKSPPMSEMECIQAITSIQEAAFHEQAKVNLAEAEGFLKKNKKNKNVVSLEKGKVQYVIEQQGNGESLQANLSPVIRYTGKYLSGEIFGQSKENEHIALDEMISGLKTGMIGMKEGEKRVIYIHPDLAYGTKGMLPPNSLLTFEIELIKADAPQEEIQSLPQDVANRTEAEVAAPSLEEGNLR